MGKPVATNKKAFRDYVFLEQWECGIELKGGEVKSARAGEVNFKGSFARIDNDEIILCKLHISPYGAAGHFSVEADRPRKLLLHKKEIKKVFGLMTQKNLTLIPTKLYFNRRGYLKVELALARGKKLYDKREAIKRKTLEREVDRELRARYKGRG